MTLILRGVLKLMPLPRALAAEFESVDCECPLIFHKKWSVSLVITKLCDIAAPNASAGTSRRVESQTPPLPAFESFKKRGSQAHVSWIYVPFRDAGSANESSIVYEGYESIRYVADTIVADERSSINKFPSRVNVTGLDPLCLIKYKIYSDCTGGLMTPPHLVNTAVVLGWLSFGECVEGDCTQSITCDDTAAIGAL